MKRIGVALIGVALLLGGCSNVKGEAITSSNHEQVLTDVAKSKLSDDEKKYFLAASMRSALGNYLLDGKTVSQVIDEQRKWQGEQEAQAAAAHEAQLKEEAKRAALIAEMQHAISVQPISKRFRGSDWENGEYDDHEFVTLQFHNLSKKTIKGVKGALRFTNSFGDKVIGLEIEAGGNGGEAVRLAPGESVSTEYSWKYNRFEDDWKRFSNTALSGMKAQWVPDQILFADGTVLKAPSEESRS